MEGKDIDLYIFTYIYIYTFTYAYIYTYLHAARKTTDQFSDLLPRPMFNKNLVLFSLNKSMF